MFQRGIKPVSRITRKILPTQYRYDSVRIWTMKMKKATVRHTTLVIWNNFYCPGVIVKTRILYQADIISWIKKIEISLKHTCQLCKKHILSYSSCRSMSLGWRTFFNLNKRSRSTLAEDQILPNTCWWNCSSCWIKIGPKTVLYALFFTCHLLQILTHHSNLVSAFPLV